MPAPKAAIPTDIARWKGFLASFYGGLGEELLLRLFVMTLLLWAAWKGFARALPSPPPLAAWSAIVLAAIIFGAGHLPAAGQVWPLDAVVVFRTVFLNMIAGIPCGWLFWRHGLEPAVAAHFSADIVLHVIVAG
jgi:membrane protease YdiL (CAAX protease family)